jgi:hypothetical protein
MVFREGVGGIGKERGGELGKHTGNNYYPN